MLILDLIFDVLGTVVDIAVSMTGRGREIHHLTVELREDARTETQEVICEYFIHLVAVTS